MNRDRDTQDSIDIRRSTQGSLLSSNDGMEKVQSRIFVPIDTF